MYLLPYSPRFEEFSDFKTSAHHTGYTKYIELPLFSVKEKDGMLGRMQSLVNLDVSSKFYETVPHIKIKRVIFGDNEEAIDQEKFNTLKDKFRDTVFRKLGYNIPFNDGLFATGIPNTKKSL